MQINYSLSEVESLAKKATRGAGFSWGISEEAGKSVRFLHNHQLPGLNILLDLLQSQQKSNKQSIHTLTLGHMISDQLIKLSHTPTTLNHVNHPLLLLSYIRFISQLQQKTVRCSWDDVVILINQKGLQITAADQSSLQKTQINTLECVYTQAQQTSLIPTSYRAIIEQNIITALEVFAHKTYAPATHHSRLGAGSNLSDND